MCSDTLETELAKVQTETKCNHYRKLGQSCEAVYRGWASCSCEIVALKRLAGAPEAAKSGAA